MISERDSEIIARFCNGETLAKIGESFGITRQRVHQIVNRLCAKRADTVFSEKHGMTLGELNEVRTVAPDATGKFQRQRENAKKRGIEWKLTFAEWWGIWSKSGKWADRGRIDGCYVMCRKHDVGAYEVGNVYIVTCNENIKDYYRWRA